MGRGRENVVGGSVPSNAAAIGFIRADTKSVFEYNDTDYKYGRREGAVGGNRKVFLGFKYFSGSGPISWDNPFGTQKVKRYFTWASDSKGTNEIEAMKMVFPSIATVSSLLMPRGRKHGTAAALRLDGF